MTKAESNRRSYTSPLRRKQSEITRNQIMKAVAELINEGRILSFSIKDVSDRAGVSYGTVYRHFPTRELLLEGLYEFATEIVDQDLALKSLSVEEIPSVTRRTVETFEKNSTILQAFTMALAANNIQPKSRRDRDQNYLKIIMENASFLAPEDARQVNAIICHIDSSLTWATLRQRFELSPEATTDALTWALQVLIQDLIQKNKSNNGLIDNTQLQRAESEDAEGV